jgi:4-amino-4-deoxy-L-arabinose transferase-like glycosyltransferase
VGNITVSLRYLKQICLDFFNPEKEGNCRGCLVGLLLFAFLLRLPLVIYPEVIHNDGTAYIYQAKQILLGDWTWGKYPPLYASLIALFHLFFKNYEIAGIWVSIIFGTLTILPIYLLGKNIFNEKVGAISGLFAVVQPSLYIRSGSVLTESTYYFLLATSVLFGWNAFKKGKPLDILLLGFFTSLAYLTKPEGIGLLFVFAVWTLLINPDQRRRQWAKRVGIVLFVILCFLAFSSPYLIELRKELGRWEISKKASISFESFSENGAHPITGPKPWKRINLLSVLKDFPNALKKIGKGFFISFYKFNQAYAPVLSILTIFGLILLFKKEYRFALKGSFYLMSYLLFFFGFVLPFFWITPRYTSQMIPVFIPWAALGFLGFLGWVKERSKEGRFQKKFSAISLILILVVLFVQGRVIHTGGHRFIQREAGFWMKDHLLKKAKVMSRLPQEAFYADLPWIMIPNKSYEEIINVAHSKGVQYLIIDEEVEKDLPDMAKKLKEGDFELLLDLKKKNQRIRIYDIGYPGEK